jgi:hypothetical protein
VKALRSAIVMALAKKVYDEARKPHNQEKIKQAIAQVTQRAGQRKGGRRY